MDEFTHAALLDAIAEFISTLRAAGWPAALTQEAVLAAFPSATSDDFERALPLARGA